MYVLIECRSPQNLHILKTVYSSEFKLSNDI